MALLALLLPGHGVQAAEAAILTLSCSGTTTSLIGVDNKPEPVANMGLEVNLTERTVTGFVVPARIGKIDTTSVEFTGKNGNWSVSGSMDRITGSVWAITLALHPTKPEKVITNDSWDLLCKPVRRLF